MNYESTRGSKQKQSSTQAIIRGMAEDRGLYVPESIPALPLKPEEMKGMSYRQIAFEIMHAFFDDFTGEELRACVDGAYDSKFEADAVSYTHLDVYKRQVYNDKLIYEYVTSSTAENFQDGEQMEGYIAKIAPGSIPTHQHRCYTRQMNL